MKIYSVTNTLPVRNYNKKTPVFHARLSAKTMQQAESRLPKFTNDGIFDKIISFFTNRRGKIIQEFINQDIAMKKLGLGGSDRSNIFSIINGFFRDSKSYLEALSSLTQGKIPKKRAAEYILRRLESCCLPFDKEKFDYFNEVYALTKHRNDCDLADLVRIVRNSSEKDKLSQEKTSFVRKWVANKGFSDVNLALSNFGTHNVDELYELGLESLRPFWMSIGNIDFVQFQSPKKQEALEGFKYLYRRCKDKTSEATLFKLAQGCFNEKEKCNSQQMLDFVVKNIQDADILLNYIFCAKNDDDISISEQKLQVMKKLMNNGIKIAAINGFRDLLNKYNSNQEVWDLLYDIKDKIPEFYFNDFINSVIDSDKKVDREKVDALLRIRDIAQKNKEVLREGNDDLDDSDIDDLILSNAEKVLRTINILGEKTFVYSFKHKISEVEEYLDLFGENEFGESENLQKVINPKGSSEFSQLEKRIKQYKSRLKVADGEEKRALIDNINSLTKEQHDLLKNAIKDPKDALELAIIYKNLYDTNPILIEEIIPYMNPKTEDEKTKFYSVLNSLVLDALEVDIEISDSVRENIDFSKSKYLPQLFNADAYFKEEFEKLLQRFEESSYVDTLKVFNFLKQNTETRNAFRRLGLSYSKWVKFNPHSLIRVNVDTDLEKAKQSAVRNLETDLNDDLFTGLPDKEKNKLLELLNKSGFKLQIVEKQIFDDAGFLEKTIPYQRLFKNGVSIVFEDLKTIIDIFKKEMNENEFWTVHYPDEKIHQLKETFKDHILKLRYNEVKKARDKNGSQNIDLVVQKSDMNNIQHALFLGNDAGCCTAVGSFNGWSAVTYMMNKLVSSIEVKDGDKFVGNTMCYIALVDNVPALVLDNIELKPKYQYNDKIRDAIFTYAKKLCKDIGKPNLPIYSGPNRHKVNLDGFECKERRMKIVGSTGEDKIYLDFDADGHSITGEEIFDLQMYKIR